MRNIYNLKNGGSGKNFARKKKNQIVINYFNFLS